MRNLNGSQAQPRMQCEQVVYDRGKVQIQDARDQLSPERKSPWRERVVSGVKSVWRERTDWGGGGDVKGVWASIGGSWKNCCEETALEWMKGKTSSKGRSHQRSVRSLGITGMLETERAAGY